MSSLSLLAKSKATGPGRLKITLARGPISFKKRKLEVPTIPHKTIRLIQIIFGGSGLWSEGVELLGFWKEGDSYLLSTGKGVVCISGDFIEKLAAHYRKLKRKKSKK